MSAVIAMMVTTWFVFYIVAGSVISIHIVWKMWSNGRIPSLDVLRLCLLMPAGLFALLVCILLEIIEEMSP